MKMKKALLFAIFIISSAVAGEKTIERHFKTNEKQVIEISELSGSRVQIKSWDKDEVSVKLKVIFNSSKDEYEYNYLKTADIIAVSSEDNLKIRYRTIGEEGKWSYFLGIKFNIAYSENKDIIGEIYIPRKNAFKTNFTYGSISLQDMNGDIELLGRGSNVEVTNCKKLKTIENDYGKVFINNSGGNVKLGCKSGKIQINGLKGDANILADYSSITINGISENVNINSKSGNHLLTNINGNLNIISDYSTLNISEIGGAVYVDDRSGNINVKKCDAVKINGPYSKMFVSDVGSKPGKTFYIKGQSGKLYAENITGNLSIENPYSDIELKNINGDVTITGKSSLIIAEHVSGSWNSNTEYERLTLRNISSKNLSIKNKSGLIDIGFISAPREIDIWNEYSDVKINMPDGFSGNIDVATQYGSIKSNLPMAYSQNNNYSHASGKIGNGQGEIKITNKNGNIVLLKK